MTTARTLTSVFAIVLLAVLIPRLAWWILEIFVLNAPHYSRPGPWHFVRVMAFSIATDAAIAGIVAVALTTLSLSRQGGRHGRFVSAAWLGGLALAVAPFLLPSLWMYDWGLTFLSVNGTAALNWTIVCAFVLPVAYALARDRSRYGSPSNIDALEGERAGAAGRGTVKERASEIARRCLVGAICAPFSAAIVVAILSILYEFAERGADFQIRFVLEATVYAGFSSMLGSMVIGFPVLFLLALIRLDNIVVVTLIGIAVGFVPSLVMIAFAAMFFGGLGKAIGLYLLGVAVIGGAAAGFTAWACSRPTVSLPSASDIAKP